MVQHKTHYHRASQRGEGFAFFQSGDDPGRDKEELLAGSYDLPSLKARQESEKNDGVAGSHAGYLPERNATSNRSRHGEKQKL
jgi:hypothetical protein